MVGQELQPESRVEMFQAVQLNTLVVVDEDVLLLSHSKHGFLMEPSVQKQNMHTLCCWLHLYNNTQILRTQFITANSFHVILICYGSAKFTKYAFIVLPLTF